MDGDLFPHDVARPGQAEFLADARAVLGRGGILLAQAPTGLGKTAVALTAALEVGQREDRRVLFLTARRSQHRMAVETVRRMVDGGASVSLVDLMAREAMCPRHDGHPPASRTRRKAVAGAYLRRPLHVQEGMELARRFGLCPYRTAREAARGADILVGDYNHLFHPDAPRLFRALGWSLRNVVTVVDEAHNLPARCRRTLSLRLTAEGLQRVAAALPRGRARRWTHDVARLLRVEAQFVGGESKVPVGFLPRLLRNAPFLRGRSRPVHRLRRALRRARSLLHGEAAHVLEEALALLTRWREPGVLRLLTPRERGGLALVALDARPLAGPVLRSVHAALLMSATLHPGRMYADLLGLPGDRVEVRSYPPAFPPENRLLVVARDLSLAYRRRPEVYGPVARALAGTVRAVPGNVAAFFPSYQVAEAVGRLLGDERLRKRLVWERRGQTKAEKERLLRVLDRHAEGRGCLLLAVQGGSLSEGIDYPGRLLQAVAVVGLALRPPELETEALRRHYADLFGRRTAYEYAFLYPALNRMVQCAGRCIRGPEDVGAVVLLDNRLLRPFVRRRLPPGFDPIPVEDPADAVRSFFRRHPDGTSHGVPPGSGGRHPPDGVARPPRRGEATRAEGLPASSSRQRASDGPDSAGGPPVP